MLSDVILVIYDIYLFMTTTNKPLFMSYPVALAQGCGYNFDVQPAEAVWDVRQVVAASFRNIILAILWSLMKAVTNGHTRRTQALPETG